jgi:hypothetical protein
MHGCPRKTTTIALLPLRVPERYIQYCRIKKSAGRSIKIKGDYQPKEIFLRLYKHLNGLADYSFLRNRHL